MTPFFNSLITPLEMQDIDLTGLAGVLFVTSLRVLFYFVLFCYYEITFMDLWRVKLCGFFSI